MPDIYLQPSDLSAFQAQKVLDFLNRASSAEQLARDIEFPHEPDIGLRLGQRLLDARAALGGAYTDILQVRSVRLIGPERFTEICIAALGFMPERWVELFYGGAPLGLQAESGLTVSLDVLPQPAWLGQPLAITLRVRDQGGSARAGVAVTVQTGLGRLVWMFGFSRIEGQAVTVLTGADGAAELELVTPPAEPLSEIQQAALEVALGGLDAGAPDPLKLESAFRNLAADYVLERNYNLRRAIDVYVRERREAMVDSLNPGRWRLSWPVDSALLQADALAPAGGGSSTARAVLAVTWKNWIGAWLEFLGDVLRESAQLEQKLAAASGGETGGRLVGNLLFETRRFVAERPGRAAEWVAKREVDEAVRNYVSGDIARLQPAAQAAVLTQLEVAAAQVSPTHLGSYTLVASSKADLVGKIDALELANLADIQRVENLAEGVESTAARVETQASVVDAQAAQVQQDRLAVDQQMTTFNTQYASFDSRVTRFTADYGRFNTDLATFNSNRTGIATRLDSVESDLGSVRLDVNRLDRPRGGG
jgi:hypothetical protein